MQQYVPPISNLEHSNTIDNTLHNSNMPMPNYESFNKLHEKYSTLVSPLPQNFHPYLITNAILTPTNFANFHKHPEKPFPNNASLINKQNSNMLLNDPPKKVQLKSEVVSTFDFFDDKKRSSTCLKSRFRIPVKRSVRINCTVPRIPNTQRVMVASKAPIKTKIFDANVIKSLDNLLQSPKHSEIEENSKMFLYKKSRGSSISIPFKHSYGINSALMMASQNVHMIRQLKDSRFKPHIDLLTERYKFEAMNVKLSGTSIKIRRHSVPRRMLNL